jgi:hypothetical protein
MTLYVVKIMIRRQSKKRFVDFECAATPSAQQDRQATARTQVTGRLGDTNGSSVQ